MNRLTFLARLAAPACLAALLGACSGNSETGSTPAAAPDDGTAGAAPLLLSPADLVTAGGGGVQPVIPVTGTLEPVVRSTVNARIAAVVDQVLVREGERVARGQPLVRQNTADLAAQLRQAEAALVAAQVELTLVEALERKKTELYEKHYLSEIDWAAAKGETEVKRSQVRVQEAGVAIARKALADAVVVAPIAGMVAERNVEPGTQVMPGQALMTLVDLRELELSAAVPARDVPRVRLGSEVSFTVDGFGERRFTGKVVRINPVADASRGVRVYARVPNPDDALRGGMFAKGRILLPATGSDAAVRLPALALRGDGDGARVWTVRDGKLASVPVTPGPADAGSGTVQVTGDLAAGEQVVLTDLGNVAEGTPVTIDAR